MVPLAGFVLHIRERAVKLVEAMESVEKVAVFTFRNFEQITHPDDYHAVWRGMDPDVARPTGARLRTVIANVVRNRSFQYILLHPGLAPHHVHPSRRVPPFPPSPPCSLPGTPQTDGRCGLQWGPWVSAGTRSGKDPQGCSC